MPTEGSRFARAALEFVSSMPESQTTKVLREIKAEVAASVGSPRMSDQTMREMIELTANTGPKTGG